MVGFGEEFLFRGYLQTRLVARLGLGRGWILTALIFSLIHLPQRLVTPGTGIGDAAAATLGLLPVSLLLGFIMLRVQNVVAPGLFHTFANWASEVL
jgi:membrane protease YdiL (CAAX protease family)